MLSVPSRRKLFFRHFISFLTPIFVVCILLSAAFSLLMVRQGVNTVMQTNHNMLMQAKQSIDMLFGTVDSIALALCSDTSTLDQMAEVLENGNSADREFRLETERFRKYINSITYTNLNIFSIYVYIQNPYRKFITTTENGIYTLENFYDQSWYQSYIRKDPQKETWAEARQIQRYDFEDPLEFITVYRQIYPINMRDQGVIVQNIEICRIREMMESLEFFPGQIFSIVDANGNTLMDYSQGRKVALPSDTDTFVTEVPSSRFEWNYRLLTPKKVIYSQVYDAVKTMLLILIGVVLFGCALALLLSNKKYLRIRRVIQILDSKKLPSQIKLRSPFSDEYDYFLENAFQEYTQKTLLETQLEKNEYQLKIMELLALQSQINPHFLFNTLETIKWESIGLTRSENEVSSMLETLSDIVKYSLCHPRETVTLQEEIEASKSYVRILQYRYVDKFDVIWKYDPVILDYNVPKLIFQPLIENSIYHGIKEKEGFGRLRIWIRQKEDWIQIRITDNGVGMSKDELETVRNNLIGELDIDSIGMYNTCRRLRLIFGEQFQFRIMSKQGLGTRIDISICRQPNNNFRTYS